MIGGVFIFSLITGSLSSIVDSWDRKNADL